MTPAQLFATARVARLATVDATGAPHLVPIVFAVTSEHATGEHGTREHASHEHGTREHGTGDLIHTAVDGKPKSTRALRRLANIAAEPRVSVLADHYDEDWTRLWWVRADGTARVHDGSAEALAALTERYPQYRENPPPGPFIEITVRRWSSWRGDRES